MHSTLALAIGLNDRPVAFVLQNCALAGKGQVDELEHPSH
jgi:hypothetical protein